MKKRVAGKIGRYRNGVPLLPRRRDGKTVTLEMVNRLRDEEAFLDPITGRRTSTSGAEAQPSPRILKRHSELTP